MRFSISAREACEIETLPKNWVLISINDEHCDLIPLKLDRKDKRILTLTFSDTNAPLEYKGLTYRPLYEDDAHKILKFIEKNKDKNFLIHCRAGISRSAAIALFINVEYGHELKENFWNLSLSNTHILGILIREKRKK